jgi:hypothetical protein
MEIKDLKIGKLYIFNLPATGKWIAKYAGKNKSQVMHSNCYCFDHEDRYESDKSAMCILSDIGTITLPNKEEIEKFVELFPDCKFSEEPLQFSPF